MLTSQADGRLVASSYNAKRMETIDYCWYDQTRLCVQAKGELVAPEECTPNKENPSDHTPLVVRLAFTAPE